MKERNRKLKKQFALFDEDVKAEDKYRVTTPSKLLFDSRREAKRYIVKHKLKRTKILVVYGYGQGEL